MRCGPTPGRLRPGAEASDPAKVARVVRDLAGRDDTPVRILLGADAVQYARAAAQDLAESDEKWRRISESVTG
ncbi:hypothetical protein ABT009_46535 [Streptomyces sp. NPDC002896]|uniref:hypothetical protein n=1 Tax=Streptomyces sp. NPDC002896 TaxID=3154438 RepID=UPI003330F16D